MNPYSPNRVLEFKERCEKIWSGAGGLPVSLDIVPTYKCNYACEWCFFKKSNTTVDTSKLRGLLLDLAQGEDRVIGLKWTGGGEPLLYEDFFSTVSYAHTLGYNQTLLTNGYGLTNYSWAKLELLSQLLGSIRISLDAASERTYALVHGCSDNIFWKISSTLSTLLECGGDSPGIRVSVGFVVDERNLFEVGHVGHVVPPGVEEVAIRVRTGKEYLASTIRDLIAMYSGPVPLIFREPYHVAPGDDFVCSSGVLDGVILPDGYAATCCRDYGSLLCRWDVAGEFRDLWGSWKHLEVLCRTNSITCSGCRHVQYSRLLNPETADTDSVRRDPLNGIL